MPSIKSINNTKAAAPDSAVIDQIRQQIGTDFTDKKMAGKKNRTELGKDDFMKLMSAQLKYQDPVNPMKNEAMAAQLAQFSSLEQMMNVNSNLEKMAAAARPQENMMAASLIGKSVVTDSSGISYDGKNEAEIKYTLPRAASSVTVSIVNAKGEVIRDIPGEALKEGPQVVKWNGKAANGLDAPVGEYNYKISAVDDKKVPIELNLSASGVVTGVQFEGGKTMLLLGSKKIALSDISKVEDVSSKASTAKQAPMQAPVNPMTAEKSEKNSSSNVNYPTMKDEVNPVKNTQKDLQAGTGAEKILEGSESHDAAAGDELGMSLWNPNNM